MFYVSFRRGYTCNPKYIARELIKRFGDEIELIWVTEHPETCDSVRAEGLCIVRANSWRHWLYQLTAKGIIVNDAFHESVILRFKQVTMNTWHAGMNYKRIGHEYVSFRNAFDRRVFAIRNKQPDFYLSGSRYFTEDTSASFFFDKKVFVPTGCPRNDIFFTDTSEIRKQILEKYRVKKDNKIILYAPTFRNGYREADYGLDFLRLVKNLEERFGSEWTVLYRNHYFLEQEKSVLPDYVIDVSGYEDMNELLAAADVLISDYSSCLWDFSITKRPSFVYATDIVSYRDSDRSFSYPIEKWPYSIACNNDELEKNILQFDQSDYCNKVEAHRRDAGNYDDGHASQKAVDMFIEAMGLKLEKRLN